MQLVVNTVGSRIINSWVDAIVRQVDYVFHYNSNIKNLKDRVEKLKGIRDIVKHRVGEARKNGEEIEDMVEKWFISVDEAIVSATKILQDNDTANKNCLMGFCPNVKTRHRLSRRAKKMTVATDEIRKEGNFSGVSYRIALQGIGSFKDYEAFESRKQVLEEIVEALKAADVNLIGVYGMGGVGKSTFVKMVAVQLKEDSIFKVVILAAVTQAPDLKRIQQQIADWIDFKFDVESIDARAAKLKKQLKREEKLLIILDDIWGSIDLIEVGIPFGDNHKGCKILMTSRNQNVLSEMGSQRNFQLKVLQENEAWYLFERKVGDFKDSNLKNIAIQAAKRCEGLPILIVTVAMALKGKPLYAWEDALKQLSRYENEGIDIRAKAYSALEVSYKHLDGDEIKSLFLLCGLLVSYRFPIRDLLIYCMGLGVFKDIHTLEDGRNRLYRLVYDLKAACLLLDGDKNGYIKMHEIVRNFAVSAASRDRDHNVLTVAYDGELEKWPDKNVLRKCTAMSFIRSNVRQLPEELECPELTLFILYTKDRGLKIPDSFFKGMRGLKVLDLTNMCFPSLPSSLHYLENLRTLALYECEVGSIAIIAKLKTLEILCLINANLVRLPVEIGELSNLRMLDLRRCSNLQVIPSNVLSRLTKLEELCLENSFNQWELEDSNGSRINASFSELMQLSNLVSLDIHIPYSKIMPKYPFFDQLKRYKILIGDVWDWFSNYETSRMLKLKLDRNIRLEPWLQVILKRAEDLYLDELKGITNLMNELDWQGFLQLKHLHVQNSPEIWYLVNFQERISSHAFPILETLFLHNLMNLDKLWQGQFRAESFCRLRILKVEHCEKLKSLFSLTIVNGLLELQELDVNDCKNMEQIVDLEGKEIEYEIKLIHLRSLTLQYLPQLTGFCSKSPENGYDDERKTNVPLFTHKFKFRNLVDLKLFSINVEKMWPDHLVEEFQWIQNLTSLTVEGCGNLSYLFVSSTVKDLSQLKKLEIIDCSFIGEVVVAGGLEEEEEIKNKILFPKLDFLKLNGLPKLTSFCTGNLIECPSLKVLWIENCPQLQTFISSYTSTGGGFNNGDGQMDSTLFDEKVSFPKLEELQINYLHRLKMIWPKEFQAIPFCQLKVLKLEHDKELLKIFPSKMLGGFQNLESLVVQNCDLLEEVFDLEVSSEVKEARPAGANRLESLELMNLPNLTHIWNQDPNGIPSFLNIRSVFAWDCPRLTSLFPISIAKNLPQLENLNIDGCGLEELVAKEERGEAAPKFVFPQLKSIALWRLEKLRCFYPEQHTLECPMLESLNVYLCDKLEVFTSEHQDLQGMNMDREENQLKVQDLQSLLLFKKIVPNLEELALSNKDIIMIGRGQFPLELFDKLKILHLQCFYDAPAGFPFALLQKFQNLEKLILRCCYVNEPFADVVVDEDAGALKRVLHLKLDFFPNMKHIWRQDCQDGQVLENLQNLELWNCPNLISLAPSSACFRNLKTLDVLKCQRLVNIVSSSIANTLVNLTNMSVGESNMVTEILAHGRDEIQSQVEIIFSKLESLKLHCLKSLTSFCSTASYAIQFPSLKEVVVIQCPKMKVFSEGVLRAPKLKRVNVTEGRDRWHWIGDLNTTIKRLYIEMVAFSGIQHLKLSEFSDLKESWHDKLPFNFFHNLSKLVVDECAFSSSAIPLNLLPFLNNLGELEVRFCVSMEEVFSLDWSNADGYVQYLSKLSKLHLIDLPKLKHVWNEYPSGILDFKNLTLLKIQGCRSLRNIFTPSMCLGLLQLQMIEVKNCPLIEEIITKGVTRVGTIEMITFPMLNSVTLQSLLGLRSFYSGSGIVHCPSLKEIIIVDCPSKFASTFWREPETDATGIIEQKLLFPNLRDLKLSSVHIEKTWSPRQLEISSGTQNLTSLILDGFGNLKYVLSSTTTKSLVHLKRLEICDCKMMEGVIFMEGLEEAVMREILLRELEFLKLKDLPKLARFCSSYLIECPALKELWIQNCPELMVFVSDYATINVAASSEVELINSTLFNKKVLFPKLEKMHILNMDNLKMIWHNEFHSDSFCQIKVLKVESSKDLLRVFPANMFRSLQNLEDLVIRNCDSLEEVFDLNELINLGETIASQLRTLDMENLPNLKHVWNEDPLGFLLFDSLNSVYVWNCPSLKVLFPFSIARGLLQLEMLNIDGCGLEELVAKEGAEGTPKFVFPQLKSLDLWRLHELKCFYPGVHSLDCPMLERLRVYNCESLETFASESENLQEIYSESELEFQIPQPLFSAWKMIPNVEHLSLTVKDVKIILEGQFPVDLFHKVKIVEINCFHDESAIFPFGLLEIFQNMEKLVVWCSQFNELFPYEGCVSEEKYARTLRKIRHLQLDNLPDLKHIWNEDSQLDQIVQSLETLEILLCDSLISLAPSSACFQNLIILDVVNCNGLVSLLTSSTAKSLVQLKKLSVEECNGVTEIVMNEGDKRKEVIIFSKLESLGFHSLPSLISFCLAEYSFKFPSLLKVIVRQCPNMKFFSKGVISTPKLECVQLKEQENDEGRWNGNLNATIGHLFSEMVGLSGLQHLELSKLPELKEMWHGKLSVNFFYNLKSLLVDNCAFVSSAVPSNLLPFLNALEELEIRNCELLEEIFDFEWPDAVQHVGYLPNLKKFQLVDLPHLRHIWNVVPPGILDFNKLKLLKIHNCTHLRYIVTPTMCLSLVQLQEMEVKNCSMIEEVITECGAEEAQTDRVIFPLLSFLTLESLPRLIRFYSEIGALECPSLTEITIVDCPFLPQSEPKAIHEATEPKAAFPKLKDLKTFSVDIEKTQNGQLVAILSCFQSLTSLIIDGCGYLKYLFSSSIVRSLVNLKMLEVCDCKMMEEIITEDGSEETMSKMLLHDLYFLKLKDLPKLSKFCTSILIECPALKDLRIQNCPELLAFVSNSVIADMATSSKHEKLSSTLFDEKVVLPRLEQMQILKLDNLKMIWHNKLHPDSFCKMKVLRMEHCTKLLKVFPSNLLRRFQNLEDLVIRNCDSLAEVFDLQEVLNLKEIVSYQLRILDIRDLPNLKHVWNEDPLELLLFDNLSLMYVWNCLSLKVLFPTSLAGGLPQLGMLNIDSCGVEELVAKQKGSEATPRFVFPRLKFLDLWRLEELKCFYPGIHILECPMLERLHVYNCERLEIFASVSENFQQTHLEIQQEIQIPQPLFSFQIIVNLEHLSLRDKDAKVVLEGQIPAEHFQKLKSIQLTCFHDESAVFPFDLLLIFYNMEKLVVACSQFKELFADEGLLGKVKLERALSQLQYLELDLLPDLKDIWHQNSQLHQVLQMLECLIVQQCDSLINLAPSSASFQNLRTLDVMKCNGLVSLMTSSTAKSLVQLTRMSIKECDTVTEIVAHNGEESKQEIIFSKLESLGLHCLPSLVSFCSAEHTLKFPSLVEISVRQCPRMQIFSKGVLSIPKLQTSQVTEQEDNEVPWNGNFNFTI